MGLSNIKNHQRTYFAAFGFGPHECYFCHEEIPFEAVHVHHLDRNQGNNHPYNLVPIHDSCHTRLHRLNWRHSEETVVKMRATAKAAWDAMTPAERAARGQAMSEGWRRRRERLANAGN